MFKNANKINTEIKELISKGNLLLNVNQNKQRVTAYLYITFSLLAFSFFGVFAIGPTIKTISDLNKKYSEEKNALKELREKNESLKSLGAQYVEIQPDLSLIDNAIPQSPKIAELTRQLENLSIQNNLVVKKLDTGLMELYPARNPNKPIFSFIFTIVAEGEEEKVNQFVLDVVNMGRIIKIERLQTGKQISSAFEASITGRAYFYRP